MAANRGTSNAYVLGAGKVEFNLFPNDNETLAKGFRYFGSTSEFNMSQESETLEHKNTEGGLIFTDEEIAISSTLSGTLTTDNIVPANLALFYLGEANNVVQTAQTGKSYVANVYAGLGYQIGSTILNPNGDFAIDNATIKIHQNKADADSNAASGVTLVDGVDYELDSATGYLMIDALSANVPLGGGWISVQYGVKAATRDVILSSSNSITGALRFRAQNGVGANIHYFLPKVRLTPNGDHALKGEDWQMLSFNVKALKKNDNTPLMYMNGVTVVA